LKAGTPEPFTFVRDQFPDSAPTFSPDGRWLAYRSNQSGRSEIYVQAVAPVSEGQARKWLISSGSDGIPFWSPTSQQLAYLAGDQILAVTYNVNADAFVADKPRVLAAKAGGTFLGFSRDGKRLIMESLAETTEAPKAEHQLVFQLNFLDELRRRVLADK